MRKLSSKRKIFMKVILSKSLVLMRSSRNRRQLCSINQIQIFIDISKATLTNLF